MNPIMDHILRQAAEVRDGNIITYDDAIVSVFRVRNT